MSKLERKRAMTSVLLFIKIYLKLLYMTVLFIATAVVVHAILFGIPGPNSGSTSITLTPVKEPR